VKTLSSGFALSRDAGRTSARTGECWTGLGRVLRLLPVCCRKRSTFLAEAVRTASAQDVKPSGFFRCASRHQPAKRREAAAWPKRGNSSFFRRTTRGLSVAGGGVAVPDEPDFRFTLPRRCNDLGMFREAARNMNYALRKAGTVGCVKQSRWSYAKSGNTRGVTGDSFGAKDGPGACDSLENEDTFVSERGV
jgi:hypothetical protein